MTTSQDSQESLKPIAKDGPNRMCSLCSKEKQESLIACRDCTVRGMYYLKKVSLVFPFHSLFPNLKYEISDRFKFGGFQI